MAFLIYCNPDGFHVSEFDKKELQQVLEDNGLLSWEAIGPNDAFDSDPNYWGERYLLIDGKAVIPKVETVVTKVVMP